VKSKILEKELHGMALGSMWLNILETEGLISIQRNQGEIAIGMYLLTPIRRQGIL
jgi:hypothetical protein